MRAYELLESKQTATLGGFTVTPLNIQDQEIDERIGQVKGGYRLYSKKGKNLGTFDSRAGAEKHEREVQYFKHQGMSEGKADYNFDAEDLKRLERIRDLPTLKAQALALIAKPSAKPMKPEKVEWFKNALENMNSPLKVIKLMYDLLLSGEGHSVVGSKASMNPNTYRQRFGEGQEIRNNAGRLLGTWDGRAFTIDPALAQSWAEEQGQDWVQKFVINKTAQLKQQFAPSEDSIKYYANELEKLDVQANRPRQSRQQYYDLAVQQLSGQQGVAEALKVDAPTTPWNRKDVHDYMDRIKTGTTTKSDKFKPIIHGSNVKALIKSDNPEDKWDLDDFAQQITTPPTQILGTNAKMAKSKEEGAITYDLTLPALSGIVVDEETGEFVEVKTCPGAGECQIFCYARKGGYRMFPASSMSAARALNFLMNHPDQYMEMFNREVKQAQARAGKAGVKLLVRIHDAGDFFSKEYYNLAMDVAKDNPDATFYFYTKMGEIVTDTNAPKNVVGQFSGGAQSKQNKIVKLHKDAGKHVKDAIQLGKDEFRGLFKTDAKGKYAKDDKGRTQVSSPEAWEKFKQYLGARYKVDPDSVITYDQMVRIPEGPAPKWNVVVFPAGHGDLGAPRLDVQNQFLMFH